MQISSNTRDVKNDCEQHCTCTTLVRSRQSMQLVRNTPPCRQEQLQGLKKLHGSFHSSMEKQTLQKTTTTQTDKLHLCAGGACVVAEPVAEAAEVRHDGLRATAQLRLGLWPQATQRKI